MSKPDDAPNLINYSISAHDDTPTLIHFFWAGNLPQYETQLPALNDLYLQYHDTHDLNVLGIEMYQNDPSNPYNEFHEETITNGEDELDNDIILNTDVIVDEYLPTHIADKMTELNEDGQPPAVTFPVLNGTEEVWEFLQNNGLITYSDELPYTVLVDQNRIFVEDWSHYNHSQIEAAVEDVLGIQAETHVLNIDDNTDPGICYFDPTTGDYYESQVGDEFNSIEPVAIPDDQTQTDILASDEPTQTWESVQPGEEVRVISSASQGNEIVSVFEVGEQPFAFHTETPTEHIAPDFGTSQGKETITIGNREIECDVFTLNVEETQYKYWLFSFDDTEKVARMEKLN